MKKKLIFILVCMMVFSTVAGAVSSSKTTKQLGDGTTGRDYTHKTSCVIVKLEQLFSSNLPQFAVFTLMVR